MTLLSLHDFARIVRRCDAKCYLAKSQKCRCLCGGRNHGVGLHRAIQNSRDQLQQITADLQLPQYNGHFLWLEHPFEEVLNLDTPSIPRIPDSGGPPETTIEQ